MRLGHSATLPLVDSEPGGLTQFLRRQLTRLIGVSMLGLAGLGVGALATWNVADPSFSHAIDNPVTNAVGYPGAVFADLAIQFFGLAALAALVPLVIWGGFYLTARVIDRKPARLAGWFGGAVLAAGIAGCFSPAETWPLPNGLGGVFGDMVLKLPAMALDGYPSGIAAGVIIAILAGPSLGLLTFGAGLFGREVVREVDEVLDDEDFTEAEEGGQSRIALMMGSLAHLWLSMRSATRRLKAGSERRSPRQNTLRQAMGRIDHDLDLDPDLRASEPGFETYDALDYRPAAPAPRPQPVQPRPQARVEPRLGPVEDAPPLEEMDLDLSLDPQDDFEPAPPRRAASPAPMMGVDGEPPRTVVQNFRSPAGSAVRVEAPAPRPVPAASAARPGLPAAGPDGFVKPSLGFLAEPKNLGRDPSLSKEALEQNARLLEGVLEDFGVKGEIINVRPGPVVTLYELEPAPGIKSSRVIGLADDIARSMSAIAARVAVVPGRNAIGIELPNARRETVYLRELLASREFESSKARLALALGKTINGEAVIADIAKFPHLLVAGTTGSGKSVAINTFILSILYRMKPEECRLIMIDPKMLELSVYDGIPHLLTPVVTDPKKAVVALKWTVREMEDRYRKMSKVGVRNIEGFNARVAQAEQRGEGMSRTVQTGFDRDTGQAVYETEALDLKPLPFIVVIIDEMADLMMVAGKDIEGAVQRLAQMARAAGIHVIMATQRPSVDVITGTIKANFPTRISFQVTSKIDSRTILGEQGAEQLLGMGDMLYMAGGGRIQRVHGPFVSDDEVEKVVAHLKLQGAPEYLHAITEDDDEDDDEDGTPRGGGGPMNFDESEDPYDQAVAVVLRDGKASTSYIQRRLGIGYNRAASIIEKMEKEGIVGPANHAGKREILVPTEEAPF